MLFSKSTNDKIKDLVRWGKEVKLNIPSKIIDIEKIKRLDLSFKGLSKLPKDIQLFQNLAELNLSYNNLSALPKECKDLKKLRVLDLGYNQFGEIPETICHLHEIEILNFEANLLKKIPSNLCNLKELKDLNLFANQIIALPDDIGSLKNLQRLNLAVNQLNKLPDSFGKLENIEVLELWLNKFELIPKIISTLPKLHDLYDSFDTEKLNKTLIRAVFANNKVLAEKLIFYGADVNYKLQGFGSHLFTTPLFEAKTLILVKFLLSKGANPYLKRELVKTVLTKDGEEIRSTGRFETFLSKNHPREIAEYLQTATLPPEPPDESDHSSDDVFF